MARMANGAATAVIARITRDTTSHHLRCAAGRSALSLPTLFGIHSAPRQLGRIQTSFLAAHVFKSAGRTTWYDRRVWKPAIQRTWKSALQSNGAMRGPGGPEIKNSA